MPFVMSRESADESNFLIMRAFMIALGTSPSFGDCPALHLRRIPKDPDALRKWVKDPENLEKFTVALRRSMSPMFSSKNLFWRMDGCDPVKEQVDAVPAVLFACRDALRDQINIMDFYESVRSKDLVERADVILSELSELSEDIQRSTEGSIL